MSAVYGAVQLMCWKNRLILLFFFAVRFLRVVLYSPFAIRHDSHLFASIFVEDYVSPKVPCIIRNAIPSLNLTLDEIIDHVGEKTELTVDVTPDGHGDAVRTVQCKSKGATGVQKMMFVKPHEQEMTISEFRPLLRRDPVSMSSEQVSNNEDTSYGQHYVTDDNNRLYSTGEDDVLQSKRVRDPVVYYSRQNDCLRTEMSALFSTGLFPPTFTFAEEAFHTGPPDAVNLWIGNEKSVSSMHKDHYENLFFVCSGQKEFILCPPADVLFLHEGEYQCGTFCPNYKDKMQSLTDILWRVVPDNDCHTKWIEPDLKRYQAGGYSQNQFPLLSKSHPIKVLVSQGEMLYIPSLWFHRVSQTTETVGVNYWYVH